MLGDYDYKVAMKRLAEIEADELDLGGMAGYLLMWIEFATQGL